MNICILSGRTTADIEVKTTANDKKVASFTLANDTGWGDNKVTSFFRMVAFGKTAETLGKYVHKGTKLSVKCEARQNNWTDKEGNKHSDINFMVTEFEFSESKAANAQPTGGSVPLPGGNEFMKVPETTSEFVPF